MKNVLFTIMLLISLVFGVISSNESNVKPEENIIQPVKVAIFPTGTYKESYLLNLKSDGELEVSMGERKNYDVSSDDVNRGDFLNVSMNESKRLTNEQIAEVGKLSKQVESMEPVEEDKNVGYSDAWEVIIIINNKTYNFIYRFYEEYRDNLEKLVNKLIEYSPLKVDIHGFA